MPRRPAGRRGIFTLRHMNTRNFVLRAITVLMLVAGILSLFLRRDPAVDSPVDKAVADIEGPTVEADAVVRRTSDSGTYRIYPWQVGESAAWTVTTSLRIGASPDAMTESSTTAVGGRLHFKVLEVTPREVLVAAAVTEGSYLRNGRAYPAFANLLERTPALIRFDPSGHILSIAFPNSIPSEDRQALRLMYGWEFVARNEAHYEVEEVAAGGEPAVFRARYERQGASRIVKQRRLTASAATQEAAVQTLTASRFEGEVGSCWVSSMEGAEDSTLYLNGTLLASTRVEVSMRRMDSDTLPESLVALAGNPALRRSFTERADPVADREIESVTQAMRREALAERWGRVPYAEVADAVAAVADGPMTGIVEPLQNLQEWLSVHGAAGAAQVLEALKGLKAGESADMSGLLIHALVGADTVETRRALSSMAAGVEAYPETVAIQAVVALGDLGDKAGDDALKSLRELMPSTVRDDAHSMADAALFAYARLARGKVEASAALIEYVSPWLAADAAPDDQVKALAALANAEIADAEVVQRAAEMANGENADVRLAAAEFLQNRPGGDPTGTVANLAGDADQRIQAFLARINNP